MDELIEALTALAQEATIWLSRQNGTETKPLSKEDAEKMMAGHVKAHEEMIAEVSGANEKTMGKKKAGRPARVGNNAKETSDYAKEAPAAEPEISEDESLPIALATAKEFVQRFSNAKPLDGLTQARAILAEKFKVGAIPALSHEQRVELIGILKAKLAGDA